MTAPSAMAMITTARKTSRSDRSGLCIPRPFQWPRRLSRGAGVIVGSVTAWATTSMARKSALDESHSRRLGPGRAAVRSVGGLHLHPHVTPIAVAPLCLAARLHQQSRLKHLDVSSPPLDTPAPDRGLSRTGQVQRQLRL